jgi:hypothetical protein
VASQELKLDSLKALDAAETALQHVDGRLRANQPTTVTSEDALTNLLAALEALRAAERHCADLSVLLSEWISAEGGTLGSMGWDFDA